MGVIQDIRDLYERACDFNEPLDLRALGEVLHRLTDADEQPLFPGAERMLDERIRQFEEEGYDPAADKGEDLINAGIGYAGHAYGLHFFGIGATIEELPATFPWDPTFFKPTGPERDLEKAGALLAAALDTIIRDNEAVES